MNHAEDFCSEGSQDGQYYESYEDLSVHRVMLSDAPRMEFYKRILSDPKVVQGKVLVDVGSGTGVLSSWAALAGAAQVVSIEASAMADLQPLVFAENGIADRVTVLHTTVEAMVGQGPAAFLEAHKAIFPDTSADGGRPCGVSAVVSEWMGFFLVHEAMLPSVLLARDFFVAVNALLGLADPAVELIPSTARLLAAPMHLEPLFTKAYQPFWGCVGGVKMACLGRAAFELAVNGAAPLIETVPAECLLVKPGAAVVLWQRDLAAVAHGELDEMTAAAQFRLSPPVGAAATDPSDTPVDGFTLWFEVSYGGVVLDTSPSAPPTHWKQTTILLPREARDDKLITLDGVGADTLDVTFTLRVTEPGSRYYALEFEFT